MNTKYTFNKKEFFINLPDNTDCYDYKIYTLKEIYELPGLNTSPPYQRGHVMSKKKAQSLVYDIDNGADMGLVKLIKKPENMYGYPVLETTDGAQRLTWICGLITYLKREKETKILERFYKRKVAVAVYHSLPKGTSEADLFQKANQSGTTMSTGELLEKFYDEPILHVIKNGTLSILKILNPNKKHNLLSIKDDRNTALIKMSPFILNINVSNVILGSTAIRQKWQNNLKEYNINHEKFESDINYFLVSLQILTDWVLKNEINIPETQLMTIALAACNSGLDKKSKIEGILNNQLDFFKKGTFVSNMISELNKKSSMSDDTLKKYTYSKFFNIFSVVTKNGRTISDSLRLEVLDRDNHECVVCKSKDKLEIDHIIPFDKGGLTIKDNLQVLCRKHNRQKGAK